MNKTSTLLAALFVLALSGCSASDVPRDGATTSPSPSETQTSEAVEAEPAPAIDGVMAAFLNPADVSPKAVSGIPSEDAFELGFFGDIPNSSACSASNLESLEGLSALEPFASQIIRVEQELPAYIIQWAYSASSEEAADSVVQEFDAKFLTPSCYDSMGKGFTDKIDMDGAIPEGLAGFVWIDLNELSGDVYSQIRAVSSVGKIVYFSLTVGTDNPESAILADDLSKLSGEGMVRFLQGL
jgi:hypothetical protein